MLPSLSLSSGLAEFVATLDTAGTQSITATDAGLTGSATGIAVSPAAVASLTIVAGSSQTAIIASAFAAPLEVVAKDAFGNRVPSVSVAFVARSAGLAGGSFASTGTNVATVTTDANGVATAPTITANNKVGSFSVQATVSTPALGPATFTLTNTAADTITPTSTPSIAALQNDTTGTITLATFHDPDVALFAVTAYTATISWGDGAQSSGVVSVVGGNLAVTGSHTYAAPGTYAPVVRLSHGPTGRVALASGHASVAPDLSGQVLATENGLHFSHATNLYSGTITLTNTGTSTLTRAIEMVLAGLPGSVTLANASATTGSGLPEIIVGLGTPLAPGQSIQVPVQFLNTSSLAFGYAVRLYSLPGTPSLTSLPTPPRGDDGRRRRPSPRGGATPDDPLTPRNRRTSLEMEETPMSRSHLIRSLGGIGLISLALAAAPTAPARGDFTYLVTVDAWSIAPATAGYLDFQFNPGGSGAQPALATVANFQSTGLTFGGLALTGATTGSSPLSVGPIVLGNVSALNEGLQAVTFGFGGGFSFNVTLGGAAVNAPDGLSTAGTEFSLGVLDSVYNPLLPISSPVDPLITIDIAPLTGGLTATSFAPSVATVTSSAVPEPSSISLLLAGLAAAVGVRFRSVAKVSRSSPSHHRIAPIQAALFRKINLHQSSLD